MTDLDDIDRAIARADRIIAACREADPGLVALAERVLGRQPTPPTPPLAPRLIIADLDREERDRLRAELAAITAERDHAHADLARISDEMGLPPTIGPAPGELRRIFADLDAMRADYDTVRAQRDGARAALAAMTAERDQVHADFVEAITQRDAARASESAMFTEHTAIRADLAEAHAELVAIALR